MLNFSAYAKGIDNVKVPKANTQKERSEIYVIFYTFSKQNFLGFKNGPITELFECQLQGAH